MPNHSSAWHKAKQSVKDAEREHAGAVQHYGPDSQQAKSAADAVKSAHAGFDSIDRNRDLAYDW